MEPEVIDNSKRCRTCCEIFDHLSLKIKINKFISKLHQEITNSELVVTEDLPKFICVTCYHSFNKTDTLKKSLLTWHSNIGTFVGSVNEATMSVDKAKPEIKDSVGPSTSDGGPSTSKPGPLISDVGPSTSDVNASASDVVASASDVGPSTSDVGPSTSDVGPSTSDVGPSTSDITASASDVVASASDVVASASDVVASASDVVASASDVVASASDVVASASDVVASASDVVASASDVVASASNVVASASDVVASASDVVASASDVVASASVVVATNADLPSKEEQKNPTIESDEVIPVSSSPKRYTCDAENLLIEIFPKTPSSEGSAYYSTTDDDLPKKPLLKKVRSKRIKKYIVLNHCAFCNDYTGQPRIDYHIAYNHLPEIRLKRLDNHTYPVFICKRCNTLFKTKNSLQKHLKYFRKIGRPCH